jgi:hypothetical protein
MPEKNEFRKKSKRTRAYLEGYRAMVGEKIVLSDI